MANRIEKSSFKLASWIYAPLYQRIAAFVIDVMVIYGGAISFSLGFRLVSGRAWIMLFAAFFSWIYLTLLYYKGKGQTIGSKVFGIKVISVDGSEISFWGGSVTEYANFEYNCTSWFYFIFGSLFHTLLTPKP